MTSARLLVLAVTLSTVLAGAPAVGAEPAVVLGSRIVEVSAAPGPAGLASFTYLASSDVSVPPGVEVAPSNVVSPPAKLETSDVPGASPDVPYSWSVRATPFVTGDYTTTVDVNQGFGHYGWLYGVLAAGSHIHDGERTQSVVAHVTPTPRYPDAGPVGSGGVLAWDPVAVNAHRAVTRDWNPQTGSFVESPSNMIAFTATLRVDGGDLVATEPVVAQELVVPLPGYAAGLVFTSRQTSLPGVRFSVSVNVIDDGDGGKAWRARVTVLPGSEWPRSGDDAAGGTWKLRFNVFATDWSELGRFDGGAEGRIALDIGSLPEGTTSLLALDGRDPIALEPALRTAVEVSAEGVQRVQSLPWPEVPAAEGAAPVSEPWPAAADHGEYSSTSLGRFAPEGMLRMRVGDDGTMEDVRVRGTGVGSFGLPVVVVDGVPLRPELHGGEPSVRMHTYWISPTSYGAQFELNYHGRAGPVEFEARLIVSATRTGASVIPLATDFHTTLPAGPHAIRLGWLVDADAGEGERFLLNGAQPLVEEGVVVTDGLSGPQRSNAMHTIAADGSAVVHRFMGLSPSAITVFARGEEAPVALAPEAKALPPESLAGADVAFHPTHELSGDHLMWMFVRSRTVQNAVDASPLDLRDVDRDVRALTWYAGGQILPWLHTVSGV